MPTPVKPLSHSPHIRFMLDRENVGMKPSQHSCSFFAIPSLVAACMIAGSCRSTHSTSAVNEFGPAPALPPAGPEKHVYNFSTASTWPEGQMPEAPAGFRVTRYAGDLDHPRWMYCLANGDVLVSEASGKPKPPKTEEDFQKQALMKKSGQPRPSADRIMLLRDTDADGVADVRHVLLENLNQPFGMEVVKGHLYVGNTDGVVRFPFNEGETRIDAPGETICTLPAGGYNNHWTRNILADPQGNALYVSVGSASNIGEHGMAEEHRRANILRMDLNGGNEVIFAAGLRNPVGMGWEPTSGKLWTAVNERDLLGDSLVPDYITSVSEGQYFGWPYSYWGRTVDERVKPQRPDLVARSRQPDYALGSHTASLGLAFSTGSSFPAEWRGGAFIGQHGSWNREEFSGYKVIYVPFKNGSPSGQPRDFLTGFMPNPKTKVAYGRPVGVAFDAAGGLLVADDAGDVVWRVEAIR